MGAAQEFQIEELRSLDCQKPGAVDGRKHVLAADPLQGVGDRAAVGGRAAFPAGSEALGQHSRMDKGADGVVDRHKAPGGEGSKPGSNGVGTRFAPGYDAEQPADSVAAQHSPNHSQTTGRSNHNESEDLRAAFECSHAVNQDWLAGQRGELLVAAESVALSGGDNQAVAGIK